MLAHNRIPTTRRPSPARLERARHDALVARNAYVGGLAAAAGRRAAALVSRRPAALLGAVIAVAALLTALVLPPSGLAEADRHRVQGQHGAVPGGGGRAESSVFR